MRSKVNLPKLSNCQTVSTLTQSGWWLAGFRLRGVLCHEVYRKVLLLTPSARNQFSSGRVYNLVTSDTETVQMLSQNILGLISSPTRIVGKHCALYSLPLRLC